MFLLLPPFPTRFPSLHLSYPIHHNHYLFQPPLSVTSVTALATTVNESSLSVSISSRQINDYGEEESESEHENHIHNRRYDFTPLLNYLSKYSNSVLVSDSDPPTSLDPTEFKLAETYRAVPAPLWHSLLKSLCSPSSSSSIGLAYAVVSWLRKHNLCFSYELLYSILIHALGRSEKLYEAFLLSQKQTLTPLTYNALIGACARNDDLEKALNLMSRMRQDGFPSDFVNYSLIIQSLTRTNRADSPILQKLYRELECDKIELDCQLINDIIVGFAKAGDLTNAMHFLAMAQGSGLSAKTATLVAVISALGNSGRTVEAEAIFEEIRDSGLKPRTKAYNALLKAYVKAGSLKDAESIVLEMEKSGVLADEHTYSLLIDAYANAGRWESARNILKEMKGSNVQPSSFLFGRILASYRDRGEWQRSFQVLKEMKSSGVRPDRHFYNVMIDTFGKYNCLDHAMSTFEQMLSEGIEPDNVTWNTLIDCHCKSGRHNRAEELFEEMQEKGYKPCTTTYNIMINCFGEQQRWKDVKGLFGRMQSQGLLPNVEDNVSLEKLVKIQIPSTLRKQLVDDWEFVTQQDKLVKLPRSPTVDDILTKYLEYRAKKDGMMTDSIGEILKGIRCYFDKALPVMLLYKKERKQYHEAVVDNVSPSTVYGAEHLLRLFVKLPELLAFVNIEEETLTRLQQKVLDFLKFLQKNQSTFFLSAYDGSKVSEGKGKGKDD